MLGDAVGGDAGDAGDAGGGDAGGGDVGGGDAGGGDAGDGVEEDENGGKPLKYATTMYPINIMIKIVIRMTTPVFDDFPDPIIIFIINTSLAERCWVLYVVIE